METPEAMVESPGKVPRVQANDSADAGGGEPLLRQMEGLAATGDDERITYAVLNLRVEDILSFRRIAGWRTRLDSIVDSISVFPHRGVAANYLHLLFAEANLPTSVELHEAGKDFEFEIVRGAPIVNTSCTVQLRIYPDSRFARSLRASPEPAVTVVWFLRDPEGRVIVEQLSADKIALPDTITSEDESWIDPLLREPKQTALEQRVHFAATGEYELIALACWRHGTQRGHHFAKQKFRVVEREVYLRRALETATLEDFDGCMEKFEQPWWLEVHTLNAERVAFESAVMAPTAGVRGELVFNDISWGDSSWDGRAYADPARAQPKTPGELGGGKFRLERDGQAIAARFYVWARTLDQYSTIGTPSGFGVVGLRDDISIAPDGLGFDGQHRAMDEFHFATPVAGDYIVIAQPQDAGPAAVRYLKVSGGGAYDRAQELRQHGEGWQRRYHNPDHHAFRVQGDDGQVYTTKLLRLPAVHLDDETGETTFLPLFVANIAEGDRQGWVLYDLSPRATKTRYAARQSGAPEYNRLANSEPSDSLDGAVRAYANKTKAREGYLRLEWDPARIGVWGSDLPAAAAWNIRCDGKSRAAFVADVSGWTALAGLGLGITTAFLAPIPGLIILAASAFTGGVSSAASILDNLDQDDVDERRLLVDLAGLAAAVLGAFAGAGAASFRAFQRSLIHSRVNILERGEMLLIRAQRVRDLARREFAVSTGEIFVIGEHELHNIYSAAKNTKDLNERKRQIRLALLNLVTSSAFYAIGLVGGKDGESLQNAALSGTSDGTSSGRRTVGGPSQGHRSPPRPRVPNQPDLDRPNVDGTRVQGAIRPDGRTDYAVASGVRPDKTTVIRAWNNGTVRQTLSGHILLEGRQYTVLANARGEHDSLRGRILIGSELDGVHDVRWLDVIDSDNVTVERVSWRSDGRVTDHHVFVDGRLLYFGQDGLVSELFSRTRRRAPMVDESRIVGRWSPDEGDYTRWIPLGSDETFGAWTPRSVDAVFDGPDGPYRSTSGDGDQILVSASGRFYRRTVSCGPSMASIFIDADSRVILLDTETGRISVPPDGELPIELMSHSRYEDDVWIVRDGFLLVASEDNGRVIFRTAHGDPLAYGELEQPGLLAQARERVNRLFDDTPQESRERVLALADGERQEARGNLRPMDDVWGVWLYRTMAADNNYTSTTYRSSDGRIYEGQIVDAELASQIRAGHPPAPPYSFEWIPENDAIPRHATVDRNGVMRLGGPSRTDIIFEFDGKVWYEHDSAYHIRGDADLVWATAVDPRVIMTNGERFIAAYGQPGERLFRRVDGRFHPVEVEGTLEIRVGDELYRIATGDGLYRILDSPRDTGFPFIVGVKTHGGLDGPLDIREAWGPRGIGGFGGVTLDFHPGNIGFFKMVDGSALPATKGEVRAYARAIFGDTPLVPYNALRRMDDIAVVRAEGGRVMRTDQASSLPVRPQQEGSVYGYVAGSLDGTQYLIPIAQGRVHSDAQATAQGLPAGIHPSDEQIAEIYRNLPAICFMQTRELRFFDRVDDGGWLYHLNDGPTGQVILGRSVGGWNQYYIETVVVHETAGHGTELYHPYALQLAALASYLDVLDHGAALPRGTMPDVNELHAIHTEAYREDSSRFFAEHPWYAQYLMLTLRQTTPIESDFFDNLSARGR